ncbi:39S ribosomal protein L55, mitochondrial [Bufo bufo]|uniref:39S ribosomal protein L55, mitochondrial n=1 Tax=Bufo bufo TaxID=8384 RepID=UPI001ABE63C8|nr:39S ribosomal protein L55, mitochondrial [Bufo bufo]
MAALIRTRSTITTLLSALPGSALRCLGRSQFHISVTQQTSNRACIGRSGRTTYLRSYPVLLVQPDGSTITVQYKEPRRMLIMPIDITTLSEDERKTRLRQRNQARKSGAKKEKEVYDDFSLQEYSQFWKKK